MTQPISTTELNRRAKIAAAKTVHGHNSRVAGRTKEYKAWLKMKERCTNPNCRDYPRYAGLLCSKWANDFGAFLGDVGLAPSPKHSLGRKDNERGYEPGNVCWETATEQARNTRRNRIVTYKGQDMPLVAALEKAGFGSHVFKKRVSSGWSIQRALETPLDVRKSHPR